MEKYELGKYKYFDILVIINFCYFPILGLGNNIRNLSEEELQDFDFRIASFFEKVKDSQNLDYISKLILDLTGYIWMMQPFGDGNTRTLRMFLRLFFANLGYTIDFSTQKNELPIIPIFYEKDEECIDSDVHNLIRHLNKSPNKK